MSARTRLRHDGRRLYFFLFLPPARRRKGPRTGTREIQGIQGIHDVPGIPMPSWSWLSRDHSTEPRDIAMAQGRHLLMLSDAAELASMRERQAFAPRRRMGYANAERQALEAERRALEAERQALEAERDRMAQQQQQQQQEQGRPLQLLPDGAGSLTEPVKPGPLSDPNCRLLLR